MITTNTTPSLDRHTVLAGLVVAGAFARSAYRFYHRYDDDDRMSSSSHNNINKTNNAIMPSPLRTLIPNLSPREAVNLPYPPYNALPGQRDVETPYGNIRVYEWGPEDGERVLLVHGISTPCIALGDLARELVGKGKRVCLFDLFGRGYSDAPANHTYNTQLYTTQILLVLASSPLPWLSTATFPSSTTSSSSPSRTNPLLQSPPNTTFSPFSSPSASPSTSTSGKDKGGFHLVGYSLGAGLCVSFASHFHEKLRSLSLIAPSGQIRGYHVSLQSRVLYDSGWIPEGIVRWLVERRIRPLDAPAVEGGGVLDGDVKARTQRAGALAGGERIGFGDGKTGEPDQLGIAEPAMINNTTTFTASSPSSTSSSLSAPPSLSPSLGARSKKKSAHSDATGGQAFDSAPLSPKHYPPHVTVSSVVRWQVDHHYGFLHAFLSTIRNAPIYQPKGAEDWSKLREILHRDAASGGGGGGGGGDGRSSPGRNGNGNGDLMGLARRGRVLVVLGGRDSVIDRDETMEDVATALGEECVDFEVLEGAGHEVVITESEEVGRILGKYFDRL